MYDHHRRRPRLLSGTFDADALASEPGLAEAVLAFALAAYKAEERRAIKARIKRTKYAPLIRLLKALPRRDYRSRPARVYEDCVEVVAPEPEISAVLVAYYLEHFLLGNRHADRFIAEHGSHDELRDMLPSMVLSGGGHTAYLTVTSPWPAETLDWIGALEASITGFRVTLSKPATLPATLVQHDGLRSIGVNGELLHIPEGILPRLGALTHLWGRFERLPSDLGEATGLKSLILRGSFTTLPDLSPLRELTQLKVFAPVERLGTLPDSLEELTLVGLTGPLTDALGRLPNLKVVRLADMHLTSLPPGWIGHAELLISHWDLTTDERLGGAARRALGLRGTDSLTDSLDFFLTDFKEVLEPLGPNGVAAPETLVAITRTYIDREHGVQTNGFLATKIRDLGGPVEVAANEALDGFVTIGDEDTLTAASERLRTVEGFDGGAFERAVRAILASDTHQAGRVDWF